MCTVLRAEFSWSCLALRFHKTEAFCEAQWRWPRLVFVLYRLLMAAYSIFAFTHMAVNLSDPDFRHHFMVYLTNWTYLMEMLFFFWGAVLAVCYFFWPRCFQSLSSDAGSDIERQAKVGVNNHVFNSRITGVKDKFLGTSPTSAEKPSSSETTRRIRGSEGSNGSDTLAPVVAASLPWYVQVYWVFSNIIQNTAIVVTMTYFGALYSPSEGVNLLNMNVHGVNSVMILIDVLLCARPVRLLHVVYPILYGFVYAIFSIIYWSQDHENNVLYPNVLDWNHPGSTFAVLFGLALLGHPLLQLGHYGIYRLRLWCYQRLYGENYL